MTALPGKPAANSKPDNGVSELLASSPGARLQKAREAKQLTVAEAANKLNLSPGVVKALEADDYRALPNATFVKGYLRSYARILDIPGEELVRSYESISGCDQVKPQPPIERPKGGTKPGSMLAAGAVLLVILLSWLFWPESKPAPSAELESMATEEPTPQAQQAAIAEQEQPEPENATEPEPISPPIVEPSEPDAAEPVDIPEHTEINDVSEPVVVEPVVVEEAYVEPEVLPMTEPVAAAQPLLEQPVEAAVSQENTVLGIIDMAFTGDCWVEVRDGGDNLIYSNLKRHGETLTIQGTPPLEAKLGNGNVVSLSYNGQPVSFRVPHHNVVRVRLGE